jgi:hypothetical protein
MMGSCIILAATLEEMKTTTDDRQATWCQSALAKGETVMEETAKNNEPQDGTRKQVAEDLAHLLDSIDTELVDMEDSVLPEESIQEDMSKGDEDETAGLDPELFSEGGDLELDIETVDDSANSSAEIQPQEENAKPEMDTSVDDKDDDEKMPLEKEKLDTDTEEAETTDDENASASIMSDKISAIVDRIVEEKISAIAQKPSKNLSGDRELKSGVEEQEEVGSQKSEGDLHNDELAALMNSRIQEMVIRTLEERMPAMIERSISDAIKKILLSMQ